MINTIREGKRLIKKENPSDNYICKLFGCKWSKPKGKEKIHCVRCGQFFKCF